MKAFRVLSRSIRDSFKSVFRNLSLSIASVLCITITLVLVALAIVVSVNVNHVTKTMEEELTIVAYLDKETTEEEAKSLEVKIKSIGSVKNATYKSKDSWRTEMMNYSDSFAVTLEYLDNNPLLDSYIITVNDVSDLAPVAKDIKNLTHVESVNYGEGMVEEIISVFDVIKKVTYVMVIALIVVTAFLISNTIKLTIFSRRNEIEIMRFIGGSNIAIKLPFIFEGLLLGILGSLVPIIVTIYGYILIFEKFGGKLALNVIELVSPMPFILYTCLILLIIGAIVGMFGSARAVRKYLKI